jgi:transposase
MIPIPTGVRIWIATGHTDMRKGMQGLALLVQEGLGRDPFAGDVFVFRGRAGSLIKALWYDGIGLSLYAKRLDRGRFVWPATVERCCSADRGPDELFAGSDRLEKSAVYLAAAERWIALRKNA